MLGELHAVSSGVVHRKSSARGFVRWPRMDGDLDNIPCSCCECKEDERQLPERSWERLHTNLAGPCFGLMWFVVEDSCSKWPEAAKLKTVTSATVATNLMKIIAVQGFFEQLVFDNGS